MDHCIETIDLDSPRCEIYSKIFNQNSQKIKFLSKFIQSIKSILNLISLATYLIDPYLKEEMKYIAEISGISYIDILRYNIFIADNVDSSCLLTDGYKGITLHIHLSKCKYLGLDRLITRINYIRGNKFLYSTNTFLGFVGVHNASLADGTTLSFKGSGVFRLRKSLDNYIDYTTFLNSWRPNVLSCVFENYCIWISPKDSKNLTVINTYDTIFFKKTMFFGMFLEDYIKNCIIDEIEDIPDGSLLKSLRIIINKYIPNENLVFTSLMMNNYANIQLT